MATWGQIAPFAHTSPAFINGSNTATLTGFGTPNGAPAMAWFEWGTNANLGDATTPTNAGSGTAVVRVSAPVNGLSPWQTYRCRLVVSNEFGVTAGAIRAFTMGESVTAWGDNTYGQTNIPLLMLPLVQAAAGGNHSVALQNNGTAIAWGDNTASQANVPAGLSNLVAVAAGAQHSLALRSNGTVRAWGTNTFVTNVPPFVTNVVALAAGNTHSLALRANGSVTSWGSGSALAIPPSLSNVVTISAGAIFNAALRADGTVVAWGNNSQGQTAVPVGLTNVVALAAGNAHTLALKANGTVVAWGLNANGQCTIPANLTNVIAVSCGDFHSLALRVDGTVTGWGLSSSGRTVPPAQLSPAVAIAGGGAHTLALANRPPSASPLQFTFPANLDSVITLNGTDPNGDPLGFVVVTIPDAGALYQYQAGGRGSQITTTGTAVSDNAGRVIFVPEPGVWGPSYATFQFKANDGRLETAAFPVVIHLEGLPYAHTHLPVVTATGSTLRGVVVPNGLPTAAWFEWGQNGQFTTSSPPAAVGSGGQMVWLGEVTAPLLTNVPYACRLVASNAAGIRPGAAQVFGIGTRLAFWGNNTQGQLPLSGGAVMVAAGLITNVVLRADGQVEECPAATASPMTLRSNLTNVVYVSSGDAHSLAVHDTGTVTAWGDGGDGRTTVPPALTNIILVAGGGVHSVALRADGRVFCWGGNGLGQTNVPADLTDVVAIAAGGSHTLSVRSDGTVWGWGWDKYGQSTAHPAATNVVAVAAGFGHSLALRRDGTVVAWGYGAYGQTSVPAGLTDVVAVAARGNSSLAMKRDGTIVMWGLNTSGQNNIPVSLTPALAAAAGATHAAALVLGADRPLAITGCAVATNSSPDFLLRGFAVSYDPPETPPSEATCARFEWGTNGAPDAASSWFTLSPGTNVQELSWQVTSITAQIPAVYRLVASNHWGLGRGALQTFGAAGRLVGWGPSGAAQLTFPSNPGSWARVTGGAAHALALTPDGAALAWGDNSNGQTNVPFHAVPIEALAAGDYHSLLLDAHGDVVAFGWNASGQTNVPPTLGAVAQIAAGRTHNLALQRNGTIQAWGNGQYGATGVPQGLNDAVAVAAGWGQSLALRANGRVVQWGFDSWGSAAFAATLTNIVAIAHGFSHFLTLSGDGTVVSWGYNAYGQASPPPGLSNVVAIAAGPYQSLALRADGAVVGWGDNSAGQLSFPTGPAGITALGQSWGATVAIGPNLSPVARSATNALYPNVCGVISLSATDPNQDTLTFRILSLPARGNLWQFSANGLGAPVTIAGSLVEDSLGRLFFQAATNDLGEPYAAFDFLASDGVLNSASAQMTLNVPLPPAPALDLATSAFETVLPPEQPPVQVFRLSFSGASNAAYRVWASTNLLDWQLLGTAVPTSNAWYQLTDWEAGLGPLRFYRAGAP